MCVRAPVSGSVGLGLAETLIKGGTSEGRREAENERNQSLPPAPVHLPGSSYCLLKPLHQLTQFPLSFLVLTHRCLLLLSLRRRPPSTFASDQRTDE